MKSKLLGFFLVISLMGVAQKPSLQWVGHTGGTGSDEATSMAIDGAGNVYTTGYFGSKSDFDPGSGIYYLTATNNLGDVFISKLDANGNFVWAKCFGSTSNDFGYAIAVDASGNSYATGFFSGTVDFDPNAGVYTMTAAGSDAFVVKLDPSGNLVWAKQITGAGTEQGSGIITDGSGNIYVTGSFSTSADLDPGTGTQNVTATGGMDIFIVKLDPAGNSIWGRQMGGSGTEIVRSIALDPSGNCYTTGYFTGATDFDPGAATYTLTPNGYEDIFISKLDASGNFAWARSIGGTATDQGSGISVDASGNVWTCGYFRNLNVDFDPSSSGTVSLSSKGYSDIFILKLDASGNFVWVKQMGGAFSDEAASMARDVSGNLYLTGKFTKRCDFDPHATDSFMLTADSTGFDIFLMKLDGSGNFSWAERMGGIKDDFGMSVRLDATGNIYTLGDFNGTADLDPDPLVTATTVSFGGLDMYHLKLKPGASGIPGLPHADSFSIWPNPANSVVHFKFEAEYTKVEIRNSTGAIIMSTVLLDETGSVDLSAFARGIYIVSVTKRDERVVRQKLILQ